MAVPSVQSTSQQGSSTAPHSLQPISAAPPNPLTYGGRTCASDLDYDRGFTRLFLPSAAAEDTSKFRVDITSFCQDNSGQISPAAKRVINKASALRTALRDGSIASTATSKPPNSANASKVVAAPFQSTLRIVSIPQAFSGGPLNITRAAVQDLILQLDLPPTFLPILYAFGSVPRISEAGLDCFTNLQNFSQAGSFVLSYLYRFKDQDQDDCGNLGEWKDRQIGVLHRHLADKKEDLFILLQPHPNSQFDGCVEYEVQTNPEAMKMLMANTFCLHQLLISSYFNNWRGYLKDVADDFAKCSAEAFSQDIVKDYSLEFHFLQRWRNTADNVVPISATLDSVKRIVLGLKEAYQTCLASANTHSSADFDIFLTLTLSQADGLYQSSRALEKRIANIAELLTNTIETKNQTDAAKLNRHMERLTLDTVDDSTSVKIITYLSLIYLPGSFVATLFGMNLFGFDEEARQIAVAKNFWLYVVIFLPLTGMTSGIAWMLKERARKKRDARNRRLGVMAEP